MNVTLRVDGINHQGFKEISIKRGLEQLASTFEVTTSDRWPGQINEIPLAPGLPCEILIGDEKIITGYIDDLIPAFGKHSHDITITGRSKTADLIDCSAIHKSGEWSNASLFTVARDLCRPFHITVMNQVSDLATHKKVSIEEGESCYEVLERLARQDGVLLTTDSAGNLVITRPGIEQLDATFIEGKNIINGSGLYSHRDRFSNYIGKGQHIADDSWNGEQAVSPRAELNDAAIRYRPLIIHAEENATPGQLKKRIMWERTVRTARSTRAKIVVQGWTYKDVLYQPNRLCFVESESLGLNHQVLISHVNLKQSKQEGTTGELTVTNIDAYNPQPLIELGEPDSLGWQS